MGRPRSAPPVWPQTFLTPTHDLAIKSDRDGTFYVTIHEKDDADVRSSVCLAGDLDPARAMAAAAEVLMDAALTLRRALRRLHRGSHQATVLIVTTGVDKNV